MSYECDKCSDHDNYFLCSECVAQAEETAKEEGLEEGRKEAKELQENL